MRNLVLTKQGPLVLYTITKRDSLAQAFTRFDLLNLGLEPIIITEIGFEVGNSNLGNFIARTWVQLNSAESTHLFDSQNYQDWAQDVEPGMHPFSEVVDAMNGMPPLTFVVSCLTARDEQRLRYPITAHRVAEGFLMHPRNH